MVALDHRQHRLHLVVGAEHRVRARDREPAHPRRPHDVTEVDQRQGAVTVDEDVEVVGVVVQHLARQPDERGQQCSYALEGGRDEVAHLRVELPGDRPEVQGALQVPAQGPVGERVAEAEESAVDAGHEIPQRPAPVVVVRTRRRPGRALEPAEHAHRRASSSRTTVSPAGVGTGRDAGAAAGDAERWRSTASCSARSSASAAVAARRALSSSREPAAVRSATLRSISPGSGSAAVTSIAQCWATTDTSRSSSGSPVTGPDLERGLAGPRRRRPGRRWLAGRLVRPSGQRGRRGVLGRLLRRLGLGARVVGALRTEHPVERRAGDPAELPPRARPVEDRDLELSGAGRRRAWPPAGSSPSSSTARASAAPSDMPSEQRSCERARDRSAWPPIAT